MGRYGLRSIIAVLAGGIAGALSVILLTVGWSAIVGVGGYPGGPNRTALLATMLAVNGVISVLGCAAGGYLVSRIAPQRRSLLMGLVSGLAAWLTLTSSGLCFAPPALRAVFLNHLATTMTLVTLGGSMAGGLLGAWLDGRGTTRMTTTTS